jgi:hypothetical protein
MDSFTTACLEAFLGLSSDDNERSLDENYSVDDIDPEVVAKLTAECEQFQTDHATDLEMSELDDDEAGKRFAHQRNGSGIGFWDAVSQLESVAYCDAHNDAMVSRDFSKRDNLKNTVNDPYHACQRLADASDAYSHFDMYVGDDGKIYGM